MKLDEDMLRLKKLEQQREALEAEIEDLKEKQKKPAIAEMVDTMIRLEIDPQNVLQAYRQQTGKSIPATRRTLGPAPAKYQHPETGQTWTGRGKAPRWLTDLEEQGNPRDKYLIK